MNGTYPIGPVEMSAVCRVNALDAFRRSQDYTGQSRVAHVKRFVYWAQQHADWEIRRENLYRYGLEQL